MKKLIALAAVVGLIAVTTPAGADAQTFGLGAHVGLSIPTGDYGSVDGPDAGYAKGGASGGLDLWFPIMVVPGLKWYTSVDAIGHGVSGDAFTGSGSGGYLIVPIMTGVRFDVPVGRIAAFGTAQLGAVLSRPPSVDFGGGEVSGDFATNFGFTLGGGVQFTKYLYGGIKYYPLGNTELSWGDNTTERSINFFDVYVGFGVH
jgi:hypothetical protein